MAPRDEKGPIADTPEEAVEETEEEVGLSGEERKKVSGEPVDTGDGFVVPVQQNVGRENEAGGGEWPQHR